MKTNNITTETAWSRKAEKIWIKQSDIACDRGTNDPGDRWFWWSTDRLYRVYKSLDRLAAWWEAYDVDDHPIVCGLIAAAIGIVGGWILGANI